MSESAGITTTSTLSTVLALIFIPALIYIICLVLLRLAIWYVSWLLSRKYGTKLRIGHIGFFALREFHLHLNNGTTVEIDAIWLSSSIANFKYKKLLAICIGDIRIQGDLVRLFSRKPRTKIKAPKPPSSPSVPGILVKFLKTTSFNVFNVSIMQLGTPGQECLMHTTIQELSVCQTSQDNAYVIKVSTSTAAVKLFRHVSQGPAETCLAHVSLSLECMISLSSGHPHYIKNVSVNITKPEIRLYEGIPVEDIKRALTMTSKVHQEVVKKEAREATKPSNSNSEEENRGLNKIFLLLPESVEIAIETSSMKLMRESGQRTLVVDLQTLKFEFRRPEAMMPLVVNASVEVNDLLVSSSPLKLIQLARAGLKCKVEDKLLDVGADFTSLHVLYQYDELQYWLGLLQKSSQPSKKALHVDKAKPRRLPKSLRLLSDYQLSASTELRDLFACIKLPDCPVFSMGLSHSKFKSNFVFVPPSVETRTISSLLSVSRNLSMELLLETMWCKQCEVASVSSINLSILKRQHLWEMPAFLGMLLLKVKQSIHGSRIQCMTDNMQIEWSPGLASLLEGVHKFAASKMKRVKEPSVVAKSDSKEDQNQKKPWPDLCTFEISCTGTSIFGLSETNTGAILRIDSVNLDAHTEKLLASIDGVCIASVSPINRGFPCVKAGEIKNPVMFWSTVRVTYKYELKEVNVQLLEDVFLVWSTHLHMTLLSIAREVMQFRSSLSKNKPPNGADEAISEVDKPEESSASPVSQPLVIQLKLKGKVSLGAIVSPNHRFAFESPEAMFRFHGKKISFGTDELTVQFDGHPVFKFNHFSISPLPDGEKYLLNRQSIDELELKMNKAWVIDIGSVNLQFPYQYNFAEAFSEETINVVKWLKMVHGKQKKPFTVDSPLPADLLIKIKEFTMELGDDPFEVKLRDNYELLEDEYHESLKRKKMLDEKVEGLKRTHWLLPSGKLEELYVALSKKNADIYIQRSKQLYEATPMRTALITYHLEDVEIVAFADTSFHGKERVVQTMRTIDPDSPYPEEGLEFNTLWCRLVRTTIQGMSCHLRDFPQAMMDIGGLHVWGRLIGAEQEGTKRAKRASTVEIGEPWGTATIERSMPTLKFYHDFTCEAESFCWAYGTCWEPVMAQVAISMESINRPSLDPSPPLPWWDKMRLLYHGRLTLSVQHLTMLMHASLNPYNTTEQMEITWSNVLLDWTNGKIIMKGDMDMYVHTASKYDDCRFLHIPNVRISIKLDWICLGNPNDHHSVMPCAPDKIPEYSSNQVHDSYRAFRSQNLNVSLSMETKSQALETSENVPSMLIYSSTLRWLENLKTIVSGVTRLTRRGVLFKNTKPRKPPLGRHYRCIRFSLSLHTFQVRYWMSVNQLRGFEILGGRLSHSAEHSLSLVPIEDGLVHRPRPEWGVVYMNCELGDSEIWLYNSPWEDGNREAKKPDVQRTYFLSVGRVSYGRETKIKDVMMCEDPDDTPTHRLVVYGLRGAWTKNNRDVVFSLFDSFMKAQILKRNLSTEALKGIKVDTQPTPNKSRSSTTGSIGMLTNQQAAHSPVSKLQSGHAANMLQQLIAEAEVNPMVFTEEIEGSAREQQLHGVAACQTDDVVYKNWLIELVNSQMMLYGCETSGYVIVSAAKTQILQRIHCPVWKGRTLLSKTTWVGSLECMQYYATVDAGEPSPTGADVMWLSLDNIEEKGTMVISDLADLVGSGQSVGGVVSNTVGGASEPGSAPLQLQRIISRCGCQFFYAGYEESVDPNTYEEVPPLPDDDHPWEREVGVDSFTLTHHDLEICTNSQQYAMILDLINNLLLHVEPRKKEALERMQRMRFQLQLSSIEDQRGPILQLQDQVRSLVAKLRRLEKEAYTVNRALEDGGEREELRRELERLTNDIYECKEQLNNSSEELAVMISCFKETQVSSTKIRKQQAASNQLGSVVRRNEVCFKHARWRLTEADGQLGIADLVLSNFLYSKVTKTDDSVEHLIELGYVRVTNLLPNQVYKDVLQPTELQPNVPLDRHRALRIFCRERPPVGGISVKEHLEVNVIPITIGLTIDFFRTMLQFFFPGRYAGEKSDEHHDGEHEPTTRATKKKGTLYRAGGAGSNTSIVHSGRDDIEKMRERAEKNHTFLFIKIPEVPLRVSYKGEKNIQDLHDISLILPTLEYHNRTWTWLDLLMEMKSDTQRVLLSQAIKQKLQIKPHRVGGGSAEESSSSVPQEEDKARLLLGTKLTGGPEKSSKRGIFGKITK